ncbi:beta-glucosidase BglX [Pinibacter aurantiacus]|uniref:Periplasmic beta-glucosidase n=1 Tax=Pinibacter aurantiacus TaxID=2851599 RepID=A0A9E2W394_9BACT|nr:beta-glucosidase BglX [Pinibacter aurantiacus]MBV4355998.1 beta-glucosidase BglX [Pinibacter aurantiacus]
MNKIITIVCSCIFFLQHLSAQTLTDKDRKTIDALMSKMTIEEKIGQLNQLDFGMDVTGPTISKDVEQKIKDGKVGSLLNAYTPAVVRKLQDIAVKETRLHIPLLFGNDIIHGHQTIFPVPLAMSCTWDMPLIERCAQIAANEASADGLNWTFSPMVDITRDPRWGRVVEGSGEDPYLGSRIAEAMVKGYQGSNLRSDTSILACVKHFALYGAAEAGRDYNTVDMSRLRMYQYYFPPYKAAVDAGAATVMTSFNEVDGIPASGNKWLMDTVLRKQWGFKGFVVTDYAAINEMTPHGLGDLKDNVVRAMNAGVDMDMVGEGYLSYLKESLQPGKVTMQQIENACRRILEAKAMLGLLDDPYRFCNDERAATVNLATNHRQVAREAAARACVLLKNANNILPLQENKTIALIGPLADDKKNLIGSWHDYGDWKNAVSVLEGIRNQQGNNVRVLYAKGCNLVEDDHTIKVLNESGEGLEKDSRSIQTMLDEALNIVDKADIIVAVLGEAKGMTGEAASRGDIDIPENQKDLLKALVKTGKPVVLVLMNGRPLTLSWENDHVSAILETWFGGLEAGNAIADVLFGKYNPSGKLTQCFPLTMGQIPVYYNHKHTGRPFNDTSLEKYKSRYFDIPNAPLYTFGYGLSYTTFNYSNITVGPSQLKGNQKMKASVIITNTGKYAGEETVQLYITDTVASVTRSVKDLKGFKKIFLQPGESKEVTFEITTEDLKFYNEKLEYIWEPGEFIIHIGTNSNELKSAKIVWASP